jgi:hypothetical protein
MKRYEYGYTISAGGEVKETLLGTVTEDKVAETTTNIRRANLVEQGPDIRGLIQKSNTIWWVREVRSDLSSEQRTRTETN